MCCLDCVNLDFCNCIYKLFWLLTEHLVLKLAFTLNSHLTQISPQCIGLFSSYKWNVIHSNIPQNSRLCVFVYISFYLYCLITPSRLDIPYWAAVIRLVSFIIFLVELQVLISLYPLCYQPHPSIPPTPGLRKKEMTWINVQMKAKQV